MKLLVILCSILLYSFCKEEAQECNFSNLKVFHNLIRGIMRNMSHVGAFGTNKDDIDSALNTIGTEFVSFVETCTSKLENYVSSIDTKKRKIVSRGCFYDEDNPDEKDLWLADPCCNPYLHERMCCSPRVHEYEYILVKQFDNQISQCKHPNAIKQIIRLLLKKYTPKFGMCISEMNTRMGEVMNLARKLGSCFFDVVIPRFCKRDTDCPTLKCEFIDPSKGICAPDIRDPKNKGLMRCLLKDTPPRMWRILLGLMGKGLNDDIRHETIGAQIFNRISKDQCLSTYGPVEGLFNETACLDAGTICNDGQDYCNNTQEYCAVNCLNDTGIPHCQLDVSHFGLDTKTTCESLGLCIDGNSESWDGNVMSKAECLSSGFYCNVNCPTCQNSKEECEKHGFCKGLYWITEPVCYRPVNKDPNDETSITCPPINVNDDHIIFTQYGCLHYNIDQSTCTTNGGEWRTVPYTKSECEQYKICYVNDKPTFKKISECTKCRGKVRTPEFVPAKWNKRKLKKILYWLKRKYANKYTWKKSVNFNKYYEFVWDLIWGAFRPITQKTISCMVDPLVLIYKIILCDCTTDNTDCIDKIQENFKRTLGKVRIYKGVLEVLEFLGDAVIKIQTNSTADDNKEIEIMVMDPIIEDQRRSGGYTFLSTSSDAVKVKDKSSSSGFVGQIVGSGISVEPNVGSVICLEKDPSIVVESKYKTPSFAKLVGSDFVVAKDIEVKEEDDKICTVNSILDTDTFFPAYIKGNGLPPAIVITIIGATVFFCCACCCLCFLLCCICCISTVVAIQRKKMKVSPSEY